MPKCILRGMDLMFLIDASGSIGDDAFEDARKFVVSVIDGFTISNHNTRVGVIEFSSDVSPHSPPLSPQVIGIIICRVRGLFPRRTRPLFQTKLITKFSGDKAAIVQAVQDMDYMDGMTATGDALRMATDEFVHRARDPSKGFPLVAVLLTDGQPNWSKGSSAPAQDALDAAEELKKAGITLFTVGISNANITNLQATG